MSMSALSAAVIVADQTLSVDAVSCIDNLPVRVTIDEEHLDDVEELLDQVERHRVDVVLVEWKLLKIPIEEFARRLKLTSSDPVIFVLEAEAVADHILEAMKAGAREYFCPPLVTPLREAFERLAAVRQEQVLSQQKKLGRIYGFLSAKGGCGATTFASHVAIETAKRAEKPVLLADFDFEAGLLRFILKAKPSYSLRDALNNMHRMDASFWKALVTKHGEKLDFISAPEELTERATPDPRQLARLLRFIRANYPIAVLDFGRWHSAAVVESLGDIESLFLIVTQDLRVMENAKELIELARERGRVDRIKVLVNRVTAKQKPDLAGLESYLGVRPAGVFSDDTEALYETWSEGRMLDANAGLGKQLAALSKSLTDREAEDAVKTGDQTANAQAAGLGRLFSFMRRGKG